MTTFTDFIAITRVSVSGGSTWTLGRKKAGGPFDEAPVSAFLTWGKVRPPFASLWRTCSPDVTPVGALHRTRNLSRCFGQSETRPNRVRVSRS